LGLLTPQRIAGGRKEKKPLKREKKKNVYKKFIRRSISRDNKNTGLGGMRDGWLKKKMRIKKTGGAPLFGEKTGREPKLQVSKKTDGRLRQTTPSRTRYRAPQISKGREGKT